MSWLERLLRWWNKTPPPPPPPKKETILARESLRGSVTGEVFTAVAAPGFEFTPNVAEAIQTSPTFDLQPEYLQVTVQPDDAVAPNDRVQGLARGELLCLDERVGTEVSGEQESIYRFSVEIPRQIPPNHFSIFAQWLMDGKTPTPHPNPTYSLHVNDRGSLLTWYRAADDQRKIHTENHGLVTLDEWMDFEARIHWRSDARGYAEFHQNGRLLRRFTGQNYVAGNRRTVFKVGLYTGERNVTPMVVRLRDVEIGIGSLE